MNFAISMLIAVFWLITTNSTAYADPQPNANPFARFVGTWTLKDEQWQQRWDEQTTESITIPNHITVCRTLNTPNSVLCEVDSPGLAGHILWSYDPITQKVHHLSSFGDNRLGFGEGKLLKDGSLQLNVRFPSEGLNTHREYAYTWLADGHYALMSRQFRDNQANTNFYAGEFISLDND